MHSFQNVTTPFLGKASDNQFFELLVEKNKEDETHKHPPYVRSMLCGVCLTLEEHMLNFSTLFKYLLEYFLVSFLDMLYTVPSSSLLSS
jgi:hypothetical protein